MSALSLQLCDSESDTTSLLSDQEEKCQPSLSGCFGQSDRCYHCRLRADDSKKKIGNGRQFIFSGSRTMPRTQMGHDNYF
jgi:hypothetical protein